MLNPTPYCERGRNVAQVSGAIIMDQHNLRRFRIPAMVCHLHWKKASLPSASFKTAPLKLEMHPVRPRRRQTHKYNLRVNHTE